MRISDEELEKIDGAIWEVSNLEGRTITLAEILDDLRDLRQAARALSDQLEKAHNDYRYHAVWSIVSFYGCQYGGPTYTAELDALRAQLGQGREERKE